MKKFGSLLMSALLCASLLAGCSSSASVSQSTVPETISTAEGDIETGSEEVSLEEMKKFKLYHLGVLPGKEIWCKFKSPFGSPIAYQVDGCVFALRREDAMNIEVEV